MKRRRKGTTKERESHKFTPYVYFLASSVCNAYGVFLSKVEKYTAEMRKCFTVSGTDISLSRLRTRGLYTGDVRKCCI